jgi:membrane protease YdiL (CAAX protease family)
MNNEYKRPGFPWAFTLIAFGVSWLVWSPAVLATYGLIDSPLPLEILTVLVIFLGAHGPLIAALLLTARQEGRDGVRRLLRRGLQWRIGLAPFLLIVGLPFVASALARALDMATGGTPPPFMVGSPLALIPTFILLLLLGGPIQEEYGWRGYALGRLQARWNPFVASLILGVVWTAWHLPFWFMAGAGMEGTPLAVYFLLTLGETFVLTWLYNRTAGSVLAAILMHATFNFVSNVLPTHASTAVDSRAYLFLALFYLGTGLLLVSLSGRGTQPVKAEVGVTQRLAG